MHKIFSFLRYDQKVLEMARYLESKKEDSKFMLDYKVEMVQFQKDPISQLVEDSKEQKDVEKRITAYTAMLSYVSRVYSAEALLRVMSFVKVVLSNQ